MEFAKSFNLFGVEGKEIPCIIGNGAPKTSTKGAVGCLYMDEDTGYIYKCTAVAEGKHTWISTDKSFAELEASFTLDHARIAELVAMRGEGSELAFTHDATDVEFHIRSNGVNAHIGGRIISATIERGYAGALKIDVPDALKPYDGAVLLFDDDDKRITLVVSEAEPYNTYLEVYNKTGSTLTIGETYFSGGYALDAVCINELNDIRIGYDGKVYETAGDAVREQVGAVSNSFETVRSTNLLNPETMTVGMGMNASGGTYTSGYENYILTDYIPVSAGDVIVCQAVGNGEASSVKRYIRFVTAFDSGKNIVADKGSNANALSYTVPEGIAFVRLSIPSTNYYQLNTIMVHKGDSVLPYEPYSESKKLKAEAYDEEYIKGLVAEEREDSVEVAFVDYTSTNLLNPETMTAGKGMSKNGTEYSFDNYVLTDYIPVTAGDVITYQARSKGTTVRWFYDMRWVCCFDEKKNILPSLGVDANTKAFTVPEGVAYVRVTCANWTYLVDHSVTKSATIIPYEAYRDVKMLKSESLPKNSRRLALPSTIYCFANQPVSIYFRNVMDYHPGDVYMMVASNTANDGKLYSDHWEYTPTAEGNRRVELKVYDHDYTMKNGELVNLAIKATSVKSNLTALVIGDSTVNAGKETQKMLDLATADGYNLTLLGTRGSGTNKHEGRAGWTSDSYVNSSTYSGLANPFYNSASGTFDFGHYMSQQGYSGVDCVFLQLGINDMFAAQSDDEMSEALNKYMSNMESIINSIHAYDANIKVVINLIIPCCANQDTFTGFYNIQTASWLCKKNTYEANIALLDRYEGVANVYLSPYNAALDTVNNMDGGVHPVDSGYAQLGTQMYSYMRAIN